MTKRLFFIMILTGVLSYAEDKGEDVKEGNLALPTSQQPVGLFGFGQNIVDKGDILGFMTMYYQSGRRKKLIDLYPAILYGITDRCSLYASVPVTPKYQEDQDKSSGIEDIFAQIEYLFYKKESPRDALWASVLGSIELPTGSTKKYPETGSGSVSFLLGATLAYWSVEWYWFVSPFAHVTAKHKGTKLGNIFYYQGGVGRNLVGDPDGWIVTPMIEFFGILAKRDVLRGQIDQTSGENAFYVGPTLWTSTKRFVGQAGVLFAIAQKYNKYQYKDKYFFGVTMAWKFNA